LTPLTRVSIPNSCPAFGALVTNPNDPRLWQGASVGTFAQLIFGSNTPENRQRLVDEEMLDDGVFVAFSNQTATLVPNSWSTKYGACRGKSTNNEFGYTCSSGKNVFELANSIDDLWFQSSSVVGNTVFDLVRMFFACIINMNLGSRIHSSSGICSY
jgi:hypothetical protein